MLAHPATPRHCAASASWLPHKVIYTENPCLRQPDEPTRSRQAGASIGMHKVSYPLDVGLEGARKSKPAVASSDVNTGSGPVTAGIDAGQHGMRGCDVRTTPDVRRESSVEGQPSLGPVAEFCAGLRRLVQDCRVNRAVLARRVGYSRSQLYEILDGRISRPPEWDRLVEPLVRACIGNDKHAIGTWRRRHDVLVAVHSELKRQHRPTDAAMPAELPAIPAQLPADVEFFLGRSQELADLDRFLTRSTGTASSEPVNGGDSTAVVISAISGTAGVGKTALALRWAHRVRSEFPDGQLYVNLHGFDPEQPLSAADALAGFLRALGVAGKNIPVELEERAAAYRSLLDGRRMLVVLDNASSVEQVRPLLPGTPSCVVVVTSRDSLAGLVARHSARRVDLDLLPLEDAVALLEALIGDRVPAERAAAAMLAKLCARLPLALRIAAELAAARPTLTLAQLISELADEQRRLELLDAGGDNRTAVRGVFSWSYRYLPALAARAFRLIGLHPGPDFDSYAVAALADTSRNQAQQIIDVLARAHLIQATRPSRYSMHDLLRAYATYSVHVEGSAAEQRSGLTRLFDYYLANAAAAMDVLVPAEQDRRPRVSAPATPAPPIRNRATARNWLDTERATFTAISAYTAARGWLSHTTALSTILHRYLDGGGHFADGLTIHKHALRAARHTNSAAAELRALLNLGHIYWQHSHYAQATEDLQRALAIAIEIGDRHGESNAQLDLGIVAQRQGDYGRAINHLQQALATASAINDQVGETNTLLNLGIVDRRRGHYQRATEHCQQALIIARRIGDRHGEANALDHLGSIYQRQRSYSQAADHHQQALALFQEIGDRHGEANTLLDLGTASRRQGLYPQAVDYHQQSLDLFRTMGDQHGEACARNRLGETLVDMDQPDQALTQHAAALTLATQLGDRYELARAHNGLAHTHQVTGALRLALAQHTTALSLATKIGERYEQARAHDGLARTHQLAGQLHQARHHWHCALTLYTELGVPNAEDVHAQLIALDQAKDN
jgi:tetratricopeptide (TPR) repeat protein